ncbi:glutaredoxin-like protein NrdH [Candidatus Hakubella thermalkaliphila]|uniref:Glutaredoxin-like protein NrdH n=1 Tax=Candidatus Hakubella thermalkaliphila TaxID=2754717 RepID=A0A6V8PJA6_9ACTN|nr:glutaredoxin-like protein NrdH [Candidatus Hakubella thermalkaliphila]GFP43787.1 glutaredoxin-like protein NrdH [Candidatus Hakubella thermalkaliphila]
MKPFLYALSTCFHCQRTKKWLAERNIAYDYADVDLATGEERQRLAKEVLALTGASQFPVVKIGEKHVVGFNEERLKELLGVK